MRVLQASHWLRCLGGLSADMPWSFSRSNADQGLSVVAMIVIRIHRTMAKGSSGEHGGLLCLRCLVRAEDKKWLVQPCGGAIRLSQGVQLRVIFPA